MTDADDVSVAQGVCFDKSDHEPHFMYWRNDGIRVDCMGVKAVTLVVDDGIIGADSDFD